MRTLLSIALLTSACSTKPATEPLPSVVVEGHGRAVTIVSGTMVTRLGDAAGAAASKTDLLVSRPTETSAQNAVISSNGPVASSVFRPEGPASDAGITHVAEGIPGPWTVAYDGVRFPWPDGLVLMVAPGVHRDLPIQLTPNPNETALIYIQGPFATRPILENITDANQTVELNHLRGPQGRVDVTFISDGSMLRKRMWHRKVGGKHLLVTAQANDGDHHQLFRHGLLIADGLTIVPATH